MSVAEWTDTYDIHHWRILWSIYTKLAWVEFEPKKTEFRSGVLSQWAINLLVELVLRASFVQSLQFHQLSVPAFISAIVFISRNVYFNPNFLEEITWVQRNKLIHMVFTTEETIESLLKWDLNQQPLNSVQMLQMSENSGHEFNSHWEPTLYSYSNLTSCSVWAFISAVVFISHHVYFNRKVLEVITWV